MPPFAGEDEKSHATTTPAALDRDAQSAAAEAATGDEPAAGGELALGGVDAMGVVAESLPPAPQPANDDANAVVPPMRNVRREVICLCRLCSRKHINRATGPAPIRTGYCRNAETGTSYSGPA